MLRHGIYPGDTAAIWIVNDTDWLAAFFAYTRIRAIAVPVNARVRVTVLPDMLEQTRPGAIFYRAKLGSGNFSDLIRDSIARANCPALLEIVAGPDVRAGT
jgi:acyl-CoA synthetase (AMP-forming)/AMP-acid ligase II